MARVVLENLVKRYGTVLAVDGVNLQIEDRELVVLVGPSGCGKSTTLRMIAGLEEISAGTITIGDRVVNAVAAKDRNIAMVFQNYALYPHMTARANMAFGLKMRRVARGEIDSRVMRAAGILGIEDLLDRKPGQLSGGQRQRVALGRAIVRNPAVFLFDEPLSNLDARLRITMRTELVKLHRQLEATTVHVTHDQVEAMTMGDRIVVMKDGRIQQIGTPLEVYETPATRFVGEFIGSPPMNFLEGRIVSKGESLQLDVGDFLLDLPPDTAARLARRADREVIIGIRPEHVSAIPPEPGTDGWCRVSAQVTVCQLLGAESILELVSGRQKFLARIDPQFRVETDQSLDVHVNTARCHLFDKGTEERL